MIPLQGTVKVWDADLRGAREMAERFCVANSGALEVDYTCQSAINANLEGMSRGLLVHEKR